MKKINAHVIMLLIGAFTNLAVAQNIVINEVLSSNTTVNTDEDGSYHDWVEVYNYGTTAIDLTGFGLSDDGTLLYKWTFPAVTLNAGQYLIVWCSDKNRAIPGSELHTNFKISSGGESVYLTNNSGITVDTFPATSIQSNVSFGRIPNGTGGYLFLNPPTPGLSNGTIGYTEVLNPPTFSQEGGFLAAGFNLTLSTTTPGATILFTTDGSEPKATNLGGTTYSYKNQYPEHPGQATGPLLTNQYKTFQYSAPLSIVDRSTQANKIASISTTYDYNPTYIPENPLYKGTVVRAKLIKPGALESKTVTKTYYISPLGANRFSLPVVSLSLDENKFFDYTNGISVAGKDFDDWRIANPTLEPDYLEDIANYWHKGIATEKVANLTYFVNGTEALNQDIGIRIHGGVTRGYRSKSYNLYSRSDYGTNGMAYPFFPNLTDNSFTNLVLRNSGGDFTNTMFRDALCHKLIASLNCITEAYQPTVTFINGEYWGILNLREKFDDKYFSRAFNIASDELDFLENEGVAEEGDNLDYLDMIDYVTNNSLASTTNFDYIKTRLDPESFSDYYISNIYFQNGDWPGTNVEYWRKRTAGFVPDAPYGHDGRWRWAIHDMDDTFGFYYDDIAHNSLADATAANGPAYPNPAWSTLLLRKLLENNTFKNDFINRFADLMNTSFLSSRVVTMIDEMKTVIEPEMPEHIARWESPEEIDVWNYYLSEEVDFANQRPAFQRNHIRVKFGITSNINATLNVSDAAHGFIKMNTIDVKTGTPGILSNPYPWTGIYFSNIPVTLKANANPGFIFSHWTGASSSTNPEITISSAASFSVTAVFIAETVATSQPIYFWMMNSAIANNLPLLSLNTTFKAGTVDGIIQYESCLVGYPFVSTDVANWRKASMERRNSPTDINYITEANGNLTFANSDMKGLQIKEPLQSGNLENIMVFNFSTTGQKDIRFSFAAINELTNATAIAVDYSVNSGTPVWLTTGLSSSSLPLTNAFQLFNIDFSAVTTANNNVNFKVRLRFTGTNMTVDTGARISFNNIAVHGTAIPLAVVENTAVKFSVYPNPFTDNVTVIGINTSEIVSFKLFTIDGKVIKTGVLENAQIDMSNLTKGMYLLQLASDGKIETKKIIKK